MGVGSKLCCESCKSAPASLFCGADSAFLCINCDSNIHAANKLASRHPRVWICDVCEKSPASVTCKADAASLCSSCDHDIHSANPLARRHQRFPVVPFYDCQGGDHNQRDGCFSDMEQELEVEAEAASWLLPNPNNPPPPPTQVVNESKRSSGFDLDLDRNEDNQKGGDSYNNYLNGDGVVPVQPYQTQTPPVVDGFPAYDLDYCGSAGPLMYNFTSQSISQSVSSSSMEVGLVPDHNNMADVSNSLTQNPNSESLTPNPLTGLDREARVLRYREKRKNRKFEKTIRYASRKAYAETRPRIKGRFAKRSEIDDVISTDAAAYGVVPSY